MNRSARRAPSRRWLLLGSVLLMAAGPDPSVPVVLALAVFYLVALACGHVAVRIGQPAVLGELVGGVLLGNLSLVGVDWFASMATDPGIDLLARIGILILLFEIGLESTVGQMLSVGLRSLLVALIGIALPFGLGWLASAAILPTGSVYLHAFLGATLTATSVGITARVLKDLGVSQSAEARVIIGAAVIDDVLGIVILALVTGVIAGAESGAPMSYAAMGLVLVKAVGFLVAVVLVGRWLAPVVMRLASRVATKGAALAVSLAICFFTAVAAERIGLAAIIGAFAAGLVLESVHYGWLAERGEHPIEEMLHPLIQALVPVFFVLMGMRTDLRAFLDLGVLGLASVLTVVAIVAKLFAGLGAGRGANRLAVGIGMVPRGEVGLIFANLGHGLAIAGVPLVSNEVYSAIVVMVIVTTMVTPPALKWGFARVARTS